MCLALVWAGSYLGLLPALAVDERDGSDGRDQSFNLSPNVNCYSFRFGRLHGSQPSRSLFTGPKPSIDHGAFTACGGPAARFGPKSQLTHQL